LDLNYIAQREEKRGYVHFFADESNTGNNKDDVPKMSNFLLPFSV